MNNLLLIIDLQIDFIEGGKLPVAGSNEVVDYITTWIKNNKVNDILITKDYHPYNHISFNTSWKGNPEPFSTITSKDIMSGKYTYPNYDWAEQEIRALEKDGKPFIVWPPHCVQHSIGCSIPEKVLQAIYDSGSRFVFYEKGTDRTAEMYSAFSYYIVGSPIAAECKHIFDDYDNIYVCGLAKDFCVYYSMLDIAKLGYKDKLVLLEKGTKAIGPLNEEMTEFYNSIRKW
jgi:nicotinamidase/pyrazinamidase